MKANRVVDHPDAFDWELVAEQLDGLRKGKSVNVPVYDFATHSRLTDKFTQVPTFYFLIPFASATLFHNASSKCFYSLSLAMIILILLLGILNRAMRATKSSCFSFLFSENIPE